MNRQQSIKLAYGGLVVAFAFLALKIIVYPAKEINADTYYYLSIASEHLFCETNNVRDAFTVGVLIPKLLEYVTDIIGAIGVVNVLAFQIVATKIVVILAYLSFIICACITKNKENLELRVLLVTVAIAFYSCQQDTASLNGEIICVFWMSLLFLVLDMVENTWKKILFCAFLVVAIANTKIQAAPIALVIIIFGSNKKHTLKILAMCAVSLLLFEFYLYTQQAGLIFKFKNLTKYVLSNDASRSICEVVFLRIKTIYQTSSNAIKILPVLVPICLVVICSRYTTKIRFRNYAIFWLIIFTVATCVNLPNRNFVHYSVLYWIPVIYFIRNVDSDIENEWLVYAQFTIFGMLIGLNYTWIANSDAFKGINNSYYPYKNDEMRSVRSYLWEHRIDKVYVNGWDYSVYPYLRVCPANHELSSLVGGQIDYNKFYSDVLSGKYEAIIELGDYASLPQQKQYRISSRIIQKFGGKNKFCELPFSDGMKVIYKCE